MSAPFVFTLPRELAAKVNGRVGNQNKSCFQDK